MKEKSEKSPLAGSAGRVAAVIAAALLLVSCAAEVVKTEAPQKPASKVLILTGRGMVPYSPNDARYEQTWLGVVSTYTDGLSGAMKAAGLDAQVHVKNSRDETTAGVAAQLIARDKKDAIVQVSVSRVDNGSDNTIYLNAELLPLEYEYYSNGQRKAVPQRGPQKSYPLYSKTKPDLRNASISGLAQQFVRELREQGYLR